jgi:hypothetical protein
MTVFLAQNLHLFFADEGFFHLNGCINAKSNRYWSSINPRQSFELLLHDQRFDVWCAITATRTAGLKFFETLLFERRRETF